MIVAISRELKLLSRNFEFLGLPSVLLIICISLPFVECINFQCRTTGAKNITIPSIILLLFKDGGQESASKGVKRHPIKFLQQVFSLNVQFGERVCTFKCQLGFVLFKLAVW